jgi:hypothetical protein
VRGTGCKGCSTSIVEERETHAETEVEDVMGVDVVSDVIKNVDRRHSTGVPHVGGRGLLLLRFEKATGNFNFGHVMVWGEPDDERVMSGLKLKSCHRAHKTQHGYAQCVKV